MGKLRNLLARHANNYKGRRMNRRVVVIESDDWGSVCMRSRQIYNTLLEGGYKVDQCSYATYDALASEEDLQMLFSVLTSFCDSNGNHPVVTANSVTSNPDFKKIRESGFREYHHEKFTDTLKRYPEATHGGVFDTWKKGMKDNLFYPQFHGREHIQIKAWMDLLKDEDSPYRAVFDDEITYLGSSYRGKLGSVRAAFEADHLSELSLHEQVIREGLNLFEEIFGYRSRSFIAPNYIYHPNLNPILAHECVKIIQGMKYQKIPRLGEDNHRMIRHTQGEQNEWGQTYLVRNCVFEPSLFPQTYDSVGECLKGIQNAFFWKKPAVITAHRLNFIGHIHPENRERNLVQFRELLKQILKHWPDVEFMSSVELGMILKKH